LPSWCLTSRDIVCGFTPDAKGVVLRVVPRIEDGPGTVQVRTLTSTSAMLELIRPWEANFTLDRLSATPFVEFGDVRAEVAGGPLLPPVMTSPGLIGWGRSDDAIITYSEESAKRNAIDHWNAALTGEGRSSSFVHEARTVFDKLHAIIRRKAFLERRVHRFLNEHRALVLPAFTKCFFEHDLFLDTERLTADFVLEREAGMPGILVELESPVHRVFRADGDWTAAVNHAKAQIARWVRFIRQAPDRNAQGEMAFLTGPIQRLVVIGRGLEKTQQLFDSRHTDTTIWTYDLMIAEAKARWNNTLEQQYVLLGLPRERPFP
jgi:hypothetical protein